MHHDSTFTEPHGAPRRHAGHDLAVFQRRFWICLALTIPILLYASPIQDLFHFPLPLALRNQFVPLLLSTMIFVYGGSIFLQGALAEIQRGTVGMMTLVSLAIVVAYGYSIATALLGSGMTLYWELATLIDVMLLGHWIELSAVGRASNALAELARLLPDTAERIVDSTTEEIPVGDLKVGDLILIRPGGRIPADGVVISGESWVNEAMVTGESRPVDKRPGDSVIGGTVNGDGALRVRVTRVGDQTTLAGIMRLVEEAQQSRSRSEVLANRAAFWLTIIAIGAGTLTLLGWLAIGAPLSFAIERTVTVLVIACPHALGLAIPLVVAITTSLAARNGILVRDRLQLEEARSVDVIVFDKTGTLTKGEQGVVGLITTAGLNEQTALALAAAVEGESEHTIARALRSAAKVRGITPPAVKEFEALPGQGVRGWIDGNEVLVGGPHLLEMLGLSLPDNLLTMVDRWDKQGKTVVYLVRNGEPSAAFALADVIRDESREAVAQLKAMGIQVAMLTGDSAAVAAWVSRELGIDEYFAEVLPRQKVDKIRELQARGFKVAMVGDGINDAPALATADVGIAIGAGTDVAIESAGIILVRNDPRDVVRVIRLSRASYQKMIQNLAWATGYNVVAMPIAAGVLAGRGIILTPAIGALLMSASTVIVALNAQWLRHSNRTMTGS
ncbi:MAG TPA: heavy metal translocating P-type ATPase [Chloroflexota bacterium]|nr:heavy metal translocating P-type ATPase [Chloroflexota bacterium]